MGKSKITGSILKQIILLFALGMLASGFITYIIEFSGSTADVTKRTESIASELAGEVEQSIREYQASDWLISYWHDHSEDMDIEYDAEYTDGTETEEKCRQLIENHPGLVLKYVDETDLQSMSEADQKLYAEIAYSWLNTRVNEIKKSYDVDYLFCVITDDSCNDQFFLFSAAEPGAVRGTGPTDAYILGKTVTVGESQRAAMKLALSTDSHLASAGDYVDYYSYLGPSGDDHVILGMTYDLTGLTNNVRLMTLRNSAFAVAYQLIIMLLCLWILNRFVLKPLGRVQNNIRLYKNTKESAPVIEDLATIRPNNEIGRLSEDISDLTEEIDAYMDRIESITVERERVNAELNTAKQLQEGMLPNIYPAFPDHKDFDIYATMDPAREIGGDFYDFFLVDDDHLCIVMADVSGKGVPAALFMMVSKIVLQHNASMGKSPAQILNDTNKGICSNNKMEMFVTVWLGILELSTGKLTAANAGHEYPIIKHKDGNFEMIEDDHDFVIGGIDSIEYHEYELYLESGSKLFLYTDGVPEATDVEYNQFGMDRLLSALNEDADAAPEAILQNVRERVDEFVEEAEQFDDLTMLCIEYKG